MKNPRIAILGSRGIPAQFGGFETFAEELSTRLVESGFDITIFCHGSQAYKEPLYKGVKLVHLDTPAIKGMRSVWFDTKSLLRALGHFDIIYWVGYNTAFLLPFVRFSKAQLWVNMDGLAWKRAKWSTSTQLYLRALEWLAAKVATTRSGFRWHRRLSPANVRGPRQNQNDPLRSLSRGVLTRPGDSE